MAGPIKLNHPWLVAVWPGMGHVALNAGVYLLAKLGMTEFAEFEGGDTFDIEAVEVKGGLVQPGRRPRSRFFLWTDPNRRHDLLVFVGEAQPPGGKYTFCRRLVGFAREHGVERVFTFAAMATRMRPEAESRVFGAATDRPNLDELRRLELDILEDGNIGGLNGVLLSAAAEVGLHGACFLGEMPHIFAQFPFPKASHAILEAFTTLTGIDFDLDELAEQAKLWDEQLGGVLAQIEEQARGQQSDDDDDDEDEDGDEEGDDDDDDEGGEEAAAEPEPPKRRSTARKRIEELFEEATRDRSKAFELKQELDRLSVFKEYEDRFLDLFKKAE
ncbi:PAC2 family protein [Gemmata sp.]|uniref:PAC2 family protein n=1 Tax=Gemmata sp. TaxID=1914242 RepID=UPI003F726813